MREELLQKYLHRRSWIGSVLDNKRTVAQQTERQQSNWMNAAVILGALVAAVALIAAVVALY